MPTIFGVAPRPRAQRKGRYFAALFVVLIFTALYSFAQDATIVGTVTDPSGAAVASATITITNTETGLARNLTTNTDGQYVAPDLRIGHYTVRAESKGFKVVEQKGLILAVGDRARVDFSLQMGTAQENITVEANAVRVQTDSSEVSNVIAGQEISQLATNGRSIYTLINLTPGASSLQGDFQTPTPVGGNGSVSFNGNRPGHNIYLLDGGEGDDRGGAGSFSIMPSMDALAEFQTLTSNYSAEYGLSSGGTMTTALKSGGRQFHATAWEFVRNNALDAHNYFKTGGKLNYNTFGFNASGPVDFWRKDHKTFFFYNMEWRKLIQGGSINQTVPLTSTYGGDFTEAGLDLAGLHAPAVCQISPAEQAKFADAGQALSGCTAGVPDPTLQQPFNFNALPFVDPNATALLVVPGSKYGGIFPAPTNGNQFVGGNNSPTNVKEEIVRVDHTFTDKFSVFGHFVAEQISQTFGTTMWSGDNVPTGANTFGNPSYSGVIHATYAISPTLLNEVAFNYNGNRISILPSGITSVAGFQLNRLFTNGPDALNRVPSINLNGNINKTGSNYTTAWEPWINKADDYQFRDDISWTRGRHQFKIGASWAIYKKIQDVFTNTQGNFTFDGSYTGNDFADFLLGYGQSYSEDAVKDNGYWNNVSWATYFQDNWRVNNRLTLNLGLRWDGIPHTYEAHSRMSNFYPGLYDPNSPALLDPTNPKNSTIDPASPGLGTSPNPILAGLQFYENGLGIDNRGGVPKGLVGGSWKNFGPRLGFAYDLNGQGKTVIRGGIGLMYERVQGNDVYNTGGNVPFSANASFNNVFLANPATDIATGVTNTFSIPVANITGISKSNYKAPQSWQFSLGVQQSIGKSVLSVSYVGTQNRHQNNYREANIPDASLIPDFLGSSTANDQYNTLVRYVGYRSIRLANNDANGHYNSLQTSLRGTLRSDLTYQVGYTYSRTVDPFGAGSSGGDLANVSNPYVGWKYDVGPSPYDRHHVAYANFVYDIPLLKNNPNGALKATLGGWQVSGIVSMSSGAPINATVGSELTNVIPNTSNRPDLTGAISYPKQGIQWISLSGLTAPAAGTWGNLGHNALRGPGRQNWNIALFKSFLFSESRGSRLEFRAETFNTWNHTQFQADTTGGIHNDIGDAKFGQITAAFDPRIMQLGMKLIF